MRARLPARYAFVVLAALMFLLAGANLLFTATQVNAEQSKWCSLIVTLDQANAVAPKRPAAGTFTAAFVAEIHELRQSLGCGS